jgi:hypothetical protein
VSTLDLDNRRLVRAISFSERLFNMLDAVRQEVDREAENRWEAALLQQGLRDLIPTALKNDRCP